MKKNLSEVLFRIGEDYKNDIRKDSRHYREVSIARKAAELGFADIEARYKDAFAIVPLKHPASGMKVRIDGRTFINYSQFESGIVLPGYIASKVKAPRRAYVAQDSMICNYT